MPFIMKAGKALNDTKAEIRVQLKPTPHFLFEADADPQTMRNEVVFKVQARGLLVQWTHAVPVGRPLNPHCMSLAVVLPKHVEAFGTVL